MTFDQSFGYPIDTFLYSDPNYNNEFLSNKIAIISKFSKDSSAVSGILRGLSNHFQSLNIYNWGRLSEESSMSLDTLIHTCMERNITPILIGWTELDFIKIDSFKRSIQISNTIVSSNDSFNLHKSYLGYQRHFLSLENIYNIDNNTYGSMSLGKIRTTPNAVEPVIRDASHVHFNLDVIKSSEVPNTKNSFPTGLTIEELCQIAKYAGGANQINCISFQYDETYSDIEDKVIATVIWYFLEGRNHFINDHPEKSTDFSSFIVSHGDDDIVFMRHNKTQRFWACFENVYYSCTNEEYIQAIDGHLPDRLAKLI